MYPLLKFKKPVNNENWMGIKRKKIYVTMLETKLLSPFKYVEVFSFLRPTQEKFFFRNNFLDIFWLINNQVNSTSLVVRGGTISWGEKFGLVKIKVIEWYTFSEICEHCEFHVKTHHVLKMFHIWCTNFDKIKASKIFL